MSYRRLSKDTSTLWLECIQWGKFSLRVHVKSKKQVSVHARSLRTLRDERAVLQRYTKCIINNDNLRSEQTEGPP